MILARFGSIFKFKEEYYVYLGETPEGDTLYAARILDIEKTNLLKKADEQMSKKPAHVIHDSLTLCFVILTTEDFHGCAAHLLRPDGNATPSSNVEYTNKSLNEIDSKELKDTVLNDLAIPEKLKKIVERLDTKD